MKIKTINLTGETKVELNRAYAFIEINNSSDGEILISKEPGIVRGNDDVAILPAKNIVTIGDAGSSTGIKEIYISGNGEVQIIGKDFAEHCFKAPASGGGSDDPDDKHFQLVGTGGIFDASSIDIPNKVWKNLAGGNDITLETDSITVDGNIVHFTENDYGQFKTEYPSTIYCIFKSSVHDGDSPKVCGWYNSDKAYVEFNIVSMSNAILGVSNANNIYSTTEDTEFHIVCFVKNIYHESRNNTALHGMLYIDDNLIGVTPYSLQTSNQYNGYYFINKISRSAEGTIASGYAATDTDYKFVAFDTEPHSNLLIAQNMEYLKKRFLKNEGA